MDVEKSQRKRPLPRMDLLNQLRTTRSSTRTSTITLARLLAALPLQLAGEVLADQLVLEGAEFGQVRLFVALGVEVVRVESADPFEQAAVLVVHEVIVFTIPMGRVK